MLDTKNDPPPVQLRVRTKYSRNLLCLTAADESMSLCAQSFILVILLYEYIQYNALILKLVGFLHEFMTPLLIY